MKHTIFSQALSLAFLQCQEPATQAPRSMNFYLRYMESEDAFRAEATLMEQRDSTTLPIEIPGGIRYAGKKMNIFPVRGITYTLEEKGGFAPNQKFEWTNQAGLAQAYAFSVAPLRAFGFGSKTVDRSKPGVFRWEGKALEKGEALVFLWTNLDSGENIKMDISGIGAQPLIEFPSAKLSQLPAGAWSLYVVRRKLTKDQIGDLPVTAVSEYYSATDTLVLE